MWQQGLTSASQRPDHADHESPGRRIDPRQEARDDRARVRYAIQNQNRSPKNRTMSNDPKSAFYESCQAAVQRLRTSQGPERWEGEGTSIQGWMIGYKDTPDRRDGAWLERYDSHYVLSTDGEVYKHSRYWRERQESPYDSTDIELFLFKLHPSELVGNKGAPFSEWKSKIERVGW